jgi:hypothetical protein
MKEKIIKTQVELSLMSTQAIVKLMASNRRYVIVRNDDDRGTINRIIERSKR